MKTIRLYGELGKKFGKKFELDVANPAEAIRALSSVLVGFKDYLIANADAPFRVTVGKQDLDAEELSYPNAGVIKIVPVVAGSGGLGKIIVGGLLIAASFYIPHMPSTFLGMTEMGVMATSIASSIGWSLVLGGVSQMLFSPPKAPSSVEKADNKPSYAFDGAVNTVAQGGCVPICYGTMLVGSQVISAGLTVQDIAI